MFFNVLNAIAEVILISSDVVIHYFSHWKENVRDCQELGIDKAALLKD